MKKIIAALMVSLVAVAGLAGCGGNSGDSAESSVFDAENSIKVVSREDGSGTRGAFIELFGIEVKSDDGSRKDTTTKEAVVAKQTDVMITNISGNEYAIGYISLGSLSDAVKALDINGVKATAENVKNGTYEISRPFFVATKGEPAGLTKDFIGYMTSAEGQEVIAGNHYIAVTDSAAPYAGDKPSGKIVVAGSSSVTPVMEKLKEAYLVVNPDATIEIQQSDSTTGMTGAIDGNCDIGMSSRTLKDSELEKLTPVQIALDGIAVIVNNNNPVSDMNKDQVKAIFTGELLKWSGIVE
ncbi:phosphate-binding protein PstS 2 [Clostridia bacterium]|nr:phosphate-binding protein PstS 2 [Clostridia bacterium]